MKILAFTDIHGASKFIKSLKSNIKKYNPDALVCTGDISIFEHGLLSILRKLNSLGKKIVIIHGNHENTGPLLYYSKRLANIEYIHKKHYIFGNVLFIGYGGDGFSKKDAKFEKISKDFSKIIAKNEGKKIILLTHGPPYGTKLDKLGPEYAGNKSYRNFVEKNKVDFYFCGHLHENFGKQDKIKKTIIINPGPSGKIIKI